MSQSWLKPVALSQLRFKSSAVSAIGASEPLVELDMEHNSAFTFPFARAKIGRFFQEQPQLGNQFTEDSTLQTYLKRHMPAQVLTTDTFLFEITLPQSQCRGFLVKVLAGYQ